eukprot:tig00000545_g2011.t1
MASIAAANTASEEEVSLVRRLVPRTIVDHVLRSRRRPAARAEPGAPAVPPPGGDGAVPGEDAPVVGVLLLLDISGFSVLCEKASTNEGLMEELCTVINGAFSKEIEIVNQYGGDVLCFLGDGLLVFWPLQGGPGDGEHASEHDLDKRRGSVASEGAGGAVSPAPPDGPAGPGPPVPHEPLKKKRSLGSALMSLPRSVSRALRSASIVSRSSAGTPRSPASLADEQQLLPLAPHQLPVAPGAPHSLRARMAALAARAAQCGLHVQEVFSQACVGMGARAPPLLPTELR